MEVAAITGHKDLAMLKRYTHLDAEKCATQTGLIRQIKTAKVSIITGVSTM